MLVSFIRYCKACEKDVQTTIVTKTIEHIINNEKFIFDSEVRICNDCGNIVPDEKLSHRSLLKAFNLYRQKHNMLMPEQIKAIREMYGLSPKSFAKLVNCCDKTIYRYEDGALQDKEHNALFVYLKEPPNMKDYILHHNTCLETNKVEKLLKKVDNLIRLRV